MTTLVTLTTKLCVVPSGKPIYDEAATTVGLDDEGGGLFVTIRQEDNLEHHVHVGRYSHQMLHANHPI